MRQNSAVVTRQNLVTELQATHPANILAGLWIVKAFTEAEFHGGTDPGEGQGHPLYETAAMLWAELYSGSGHDVESLNEEFDSTLTRYTKVLTDFAAYLSEQNLTEAQTEVTRIQAGLLLPRCATLQTAPAKGAGESITFKNLLATLKALHPADITGGIWAIRDFSLNTFHGGTDPNGKTENQIFKLAAEMWAYYSESSPYAFPQLLKDYTELLAMFAAYLSTEGLSEAHAEITRIQSALALQADTLPAAAAANGAGWRESLACAVALAGAALLGYTCNSKEAWQCTVGMLSLVMVAVPVWRLATWYGQRRALVPITQPTR